MLSQNYMAIPLIPSMEETIADETRGNGPKRISRHIRLYGRISGFHGNLFKIVSDMTTVLPDTKTLSTLLDRYGNILIENFGDETVTEESSFCRGCQRGLHRL